MQGMRLNDEVERAGEKLLVVATGSPHISMRQPAVAKDQTRIPRAGLAVVVHQNRHPVLPDMMESLRLSSLQGRKHSATHHSTRLPPSADQFVKQAVRGGGAVPRGSCSAERDQHTEVLHHAAPHAGSRRRSRRAVRLGGSRHRRRLLRTVVAIDRLSRRGRGRGVDRGTTRAL
eukprot:scaffold304017_cov31-Tisochrysis_lutea.AAC.2